MYIGGGTPTTLDPKELDTLMSAHMVFVSSFESKSGNSIQKDAKEVAEIRGKTIREILG